MSKKKGLLLIFVAILVGFSCKSWSYEPPSLYSDFDTSLYQLDVAYKGKNNSTEFQNKWINIMDQFLLRLFNDANSIKHTDSMLLFKYNEDKTIPMSSIKWLGVQLYWLDIHVGPFDSPELDDAERSRLYFEVRPIEWNGTTYYFLVVTRIVNTVEQFGIFRIIGKFHKHYDIIARQEEELPSLNKLDQKNDVDKKLISENKLRWIPSIYFNEPQFKNDKMLFTLSYVFGASPRGGGCPRVVKIDWKFDGRKMTPLKVKMNPWDDCYVNEMKVIKHEGKEFIISNE